MHKVVLQVGVTVDLHMAELEGNLAANIAPEDEAVIEWKMRSMSEVSSHLMGRKTYVEMASFWPTANGRYAERMNTVPKVVFSKTLTRADWPESRIASGDLAEEIAALKAEPGDGDLMAFGGVEFVQTLARHNLIDEYRLVIRPAALGAGRPVFKDLPKPLSLTLVSSESFADNTVISVYRPAES
ncbi:MAG TPA: dihydrofolate reductase family protein [Pseudonocardiaceae bacterium]|nr:dihydrofolate reductase family protein [Pseudonocardiaceae bacterium]